MNLTDEQKENWQKFRNTTPKTDISKQKHKASLIIDKQLWRDFSCAVIIKKGRCNLNSETIEELIKDYIKSFS